MEEIRKIIEIEWKDGLKTKIYQPYFGSIYALTSFLDIDNYKKSMWDISSKLLEIQSQSRMKKRGLFKKLVSPSIEDIIWDIPIDHLQFFELQNLKIASKVESKQTKKGIISSFTVEDNSSQLSCYLHSKKYPDIYNRIEEKNVGDKIHLIVQPFFLNEPEPAEIKNIDELIYHTNIDELILHFLSHR